MSDTVIRIEKLGKKYTLSHRENQNSSYSSLRDTLANRAKGILNYVQKPVSWTKSSSQEDFWALSDVSFEVKQGDRVGIIGRNGAGKSTLLKLLSRITEPTTGEIRLKGRVASLLEVGTGFHPELTGRENIYLNGSVLGMSKIEINKKFDEIVEFSGVEKFLDTPVKRFSSGMYVRLAFSVAAHIEPEILIVDEVLAVGDARFQEKCLGRLKEIGEQGRTVLYVSHSMTTVNSLCNRALLLDQGKIVDSGLPSEVIHEYLSSKKSSSLSTTNVRESARYIGDESACLLSASIQNALGKVVSEAEIDCPIEIHMRYETRRHIECVPNFHVHTSAGICAFVTAHPQIVQHSPGEHTAVCKIPENFLNDGVYSVGLALTSFEQGVQVHFFEQNALNFNVRDSMESTVGRAGWKGVIPGIVRPELRWEIHKH